MNEMDKYRVLAEKSKPGSLKWEIYNALAIWWRGSSAGGQTIGRAGEVIPLVDVLTKIAAKLESGELDHIPPTDIPE